MNRGGSCVVIFGPSPSGGEWLGDCPVIGFEGKGEPSPRRSLTRDERQAKRRRNKARRQAVRAGRR